MAAEAVAARQKIVETFAKHNFDFSPPSWHASATISSERIYKPIRMRIRYTCHCCQTSFGRDKECIGCQHRRCSRCDRYPPKKAPTPTPKQKAEVTATTPLETPLETPAQGETAEEKPCTCHECQTEVVIGVDQCPNCHHTICERCHQETGIFDESQQKTETTVVPSKPIDPIAKAPPESKENTEVAG
jgi:hypothetical protein